MLSKVEEEKSGFLVVHAIPSDRRVSTAAKEVRERSPFRENSVSRLDLEVGCLVHQQYDQRIEAHIGV